MKQNTNIFIIIGVITLACGQLYGLTEKQSVELSRLKDLNKNLMVAMPKAFRQ